MRFPPIPRRQTLVLPFGYRISVHLVNRKQMNRELKHAKGLWVTEWGKGGRILIADDQPYDERIDTLSHELRHALTDYQGWLRLELEVPFRAMLMEGLARDMEEADE